MSFLANDQWSEDEVYMVGHHDGDMKQVSLLMIMEAGFEDDVAGPLGEDASLMRHKTDEVRTASLLQMGQVMAVERHAGE
jgi:hypothetical protein